jgi:hypothetical protein
MVVEEYDWPNHVIPYPSTSLALLLPRPSHSRVDVRNDAVIFLGCTATAGDRRALAIGSKTFTVKDDERFRVSTVLAQLC